MIKFKNNFERNCWFDFYNNHCHQGTESLSTQDLKMRIIEVAELSDLFLEKLQERDSTRQPDNNQSDN